MLSKASSSENEVVDNNEVKTESKPKKGFGDVLFNAVFIAMVGAFIVWDSVEPTIRKNDLETGSGKALENAIAFFNKKPYLQDKLYIPFVVAIVSFGCMALCELLEKKCNQKWLSNFSLGLSMIVGMAAAAVLALI